MQIKLIRHAPSEANVGLVNASLVGDHNVSITPEGACLAWSTGYNNANFFVNCLKYRSPYKRTRQTLDEILKGVRSAGVRVHGRIYEDPRLREVEWGIGSSLTDWKKLEKMKETYGSFYVRRPGGESCADCYDRCAAFVGTLMRQIDRKSAQTVAIVSHGLTIRCLVASFMHLTVEEFETLRNPANCEIVTIFDETHTQLPQFTCGRWGVSGLRISETS